MKITKDVKYHSCIIQVVQFGASCASLGPPSKGPFLPHFLERVPFSGLALLVHQWCACVPLGSNGSIWEAREGEKGETDKTIGLGEMEGMGFANVFCLKIHFHKSIFF